jgi:hypothetical protein
LDLDAIFGPDEGPVAPVPARGEITTPADLAPEWFERWQERAAIMEHDGGLSPERADALPLANIAEQMTAAEGVSATATEWLAARFREKRTWPSVELLAAADQAGFSRLALFEAKKSLGIPAAKRNGPDAFAWSVPEGWMAPSDRPCPCPACTPPKGGR